MACGQMPLGGCDDPDLTHDGSCVNLITLDATTNKLIFADRRQYESDEEPWWCIHNPTISWKSLRRTIAWQEQPIKKRPKDWKVFQARNRTQVNEWLRTNGYATHFQGTTNRKGENTMVNLTDERGNTSPRLSMLERRIARLQAEADRIASLPTEPQGMEEDGTNVIYFVKNFGGSNMYDYAAVKAGDNLWYTTGPRTPKGYRWEDLIAWITDDGQTDVTIWATTEMEPLG